MKINILKSSVALVLAALPLAQAEEKKLELSPGGGASGGTLKVGGNGTVTFQAVSEQKNGDASNSASSSIKTAADGTVTVEIDVNGKKESKTFKLGDGPFTWKVEDGGGAAAAAGKVGELLKAGKAFMGKTEKMTFLGVAADAVTDDVRAQLPLQAGEGLSVRHVMPDSPAAKAGLEEHDILIRLDDQILVSGEQLRSLVKMRKPGDTVKLTYLRKGEKKEATAALIEHEGEVDREDAVRRLWGPGSELLRGEGREKMKEVEERLRDLKSKIPGMIVDKKSFLIGPDGAVKKLYTEKLQQSVESLRKQLEDARITPEQKEDIRKSLEEALRNAREAVEKVEDLVKKNNDQKLEEKKP